jgi:predicted RNase H-like nuclease (RuvC/YqgF family)
VVRTTQRDEKGYGVDGDFIAKVSGGIAALGAAIYGALRMVKKDRREDTMVQATDSAMMQVIETLRDEVDRLSKRLEAVEEQNHRCEERNESLHLEIVALKKQLHLA